MKLASVAVLASLSVAGCTATNPPNVLPDFNPADPIMGLREAHHHSVIDYRHREPTEPKNWRQLNDRLAPGNEGAGS
ncbi:hypothetical protein EET67_21650 [Pseudaminobacter arsenicus]|uniref:Uncharacterized protein n=1 Tax=Borborobacter arsenicus TaxID=1851146 RepID=A0A432V109_9HYPH|nr:hypothetical protein [Pseudaminobacter arsenicus]RUM95732.1 hypothetical protein EET67_21650 [Pseudaminobacter arsenicus]